MQIGTAQDYRTFETERYVHVTKKIRPAAKLYDKAFTNRATGSSRIVQLHVDSKKAPWTTLQKHEEVNGEDDFKLKPIEEIRKELKKDITVTFGDYPHPQTEKFRKLAKSGGVNLLFIH